MRHLCSRLLAVSLTVAATALSTNAAACGGFFCTTLPINQAGEQIVFHQEQNEITAMVRILYTGNAEDFSWVVPVPTSPDISLGSDTTFTELEFATRPQFNLRQEGQVCEKDLLVNTANLASGSGGTSENDSDGGVVVEKELSVGPFDIKVISSDNPDDMAIWLEDNNYLLTDRGRDLLEPYVIAGMKFVAMKLKSGEQTGSIQPLIMKYQSTKPMIPIRLTAIAAEDDMGVLVWIVNNARAIPENYEHVVPNYTKLNWYSGSGAAYNSYQTLITDAMNEAGGQGFATDYAGAITNNITESLTAPSSIEARLNQLDTIGNNAQYISTAMQQTLNQNALLAAVQAFLPLPEGRASNIYFDANELAAIYSNDELSDARIKLREAIVDRELEPVRNGVALLPQNAYLTRLYTTLSADEMTVDPTFNYNSDMPEQNIVREALLSASCENNVSRWSLTLGKGTGRDGEVVISTVDNPVPRFIGVPIAVNDEPAVYRRQRTSAEAGPELLFEATASTLEIAADGSATGGSKNKVIAASDSDGFLGAAGPFWIVLTGLLLVFRRHSTA